jgi:Spy/CpxP family protein refolding chaperone
VQKTFLNFLFACCVRKAMKRNITQHITLVLIAATTLFTLTAGTTYAQNGAKKPRNAQAGQTANGRRGAQKNPLTNLGGAIKAAELTPEQKAKIHDLQVKMVEDIKASLTPDQLKAFDEAMKSAPKGQDAKGQEANKAEKTVDGEAPTKRAAGGRNGGGALMTQLNTELSLTADQQAKILPLVQDAQKEIAQKTKDARANGADPKATRQDVMGLMNALKDKIRPILTATQQPKLDAVELGRRKKK